MSIHTPVELRIFRTQSGRAPFLRWFESLRDTTVQARIMQRLDRLQSGNIGDCRSLDRGLFELRIDVGPGYRVYCAKFTSGIYLILHGGSKRTQSSDIAKARQWLDEARKRRDR